MSSDLGLGNTYSGPREGETVVRHHSSRCVVVREPDLSGICQGQGRPKSDSRAPMGLYTTPLSFLGTGSDGCCVMLITRLGVLLLFVCVEVQASPLVH